MKDSATLRISCKSDYFRFNTLHVYIFVYRMFQKTVPLNNRCTIVAGIFFLEHTVVFFIKWQDSFC